MACARMGSPDGGWYDEDPPRILATHPVERSTGVTAKKMTIYFDEYIKLADASQNVIVSPPQLEMPEIQAKGRKIVIELTLSTSGSSSGASGRVSTGSRCLV